VNEINVTWFSNWCWFAQIIERKKIQQRQRPQKHKSKIVPMVKRLRTELVATWKGDQLSNWGWVSQICTFTSKGWWLLQARPKSAKSLNKVLQGKGKSHQKLKKVLTKICMYGLSWGTQILAMVSKGKQGKKVSNLHTCILHCNASK